METKWLILSRPKRIASVSIWHQVRVGFGGAWSYRSSLQSHLPGENADPCHCSPVPCVLFKVIKKGVFHSLLSQIQNLGYFPVRDLQLNLEIPEMSKNGKRLLQISDIYIDKVSLESLKCWIQALNFVAKWKNVLLCYLFHVPHSSWYPIMCDMLTCWYLLRLWLQRDGTDCSPPQHAAPSRMATDELSRISVKYKPHKLGFGSVFFQWLMSASFTQNQVDTLNLPFHCRVNVASHREVTVRISGVMRIENLHTVRIKHPKHENLAVVGSGHFRVSSFKPFCFYFLSAPI